MEKKRSSRIIMTNEARVLREMRVDLGYTMLKAGELSKCSHLIVIFSKNTEGSMWVPFELGAAYKSDKGIGTYLADHVLTPEYLNTFPKLKTNADIDKFVDEYKDDQRITKSAAYTADRAMTLNESAGSAKADRFITRLKSRLGQ